MRYGLIALEAFDDPPLHMETLVETTDALQATSEYDVAHDALKAQLDANQTEAIELTKATDEEVEDPSLEPTDADPSSTVDDPSSEPEALADSDALSEEGATDLDGKRTVGATEALRHDYFTRVVLEALSFDDVTSTLGSIAGGVKDLSLTAFRLLSQLATVLAHLGILYVPRIANRMKKGVVYLFIRSAKLLFGTIDALSVFMKRYVESTQKSQQALTMLRTQLVDLPSPTVKTPEERGACTDPKLVSWLTTQHRIDPVGSVTTLIAFVRSAVTEINTGMMRDLGSVKKLIELSQSGVRGDLAAFLAVTPMSSQYLKRSILGYSVEPELIDTWVYPTVLPDHLRFIANLPKSNLQELDDITRAYQASGLFLAPDAAPSTSADKADYMDLTTLSRFLDGLEQLSALAVSHQALYAQVIKDADALKFGYRHYYQRLSESAEAASVRTSLVEFVHLKQSFVSKVYLPAAMDIHDYVNAYLVRAIRFAKQNLQALGG